MSATSEAVFAAIKDVLGLPSKELTECVITLKAGQPALVRTTHLVIATDGHSETRRQLFMLAPREQK